MSGPIVVTVCIGSSSESWELQWPPYPWHSRAEWSIKSGPAARRGSLVWCFEYRYAAWQRRRQQTRCMTCPQNGPTRKGARIMTDSQRTDFPAFTEHRVQRDRGSLYVRDFPGSGAAFVLLHGFPDNSHIYDDLIPHLASAGRRTISVDFLGFGASDKPDGAHYSFEQQLQDLEAVAEALRLEKIIPVGHDAGGPTAVNFALKHPERAAGVCLMNAFYGDAPGLRVPELIELFANKRLKSLARH